MTVYPVIHYLDRATAMAQVIVAREAGANGVFLISHHGNDTELSYVAREAKKAHPDFAIGINLLSRSPLDAVIHALAGDLDMVWADDMGVDSRGVSLEGTALAEFAARWQPLLLFASVAFKYRAPDPDPAQAAQNALNVGFIPTTSGSATGSAPDIAKIVAMSEAVNGKLAIASGMTPDNIATYAPYLSHVLVATGVASDEHRIDRVKLEQLVASAHAAAVTPDTGEVASPSTLG